MNKLATTLTVAALLAAGLGTVTAASAQTTVVASTAFSSIGDCSALDENPEDWNTIGITDKLKNAGVSYDSISTFGNCFKVMLNNDDGTKTLALYDPTTLNLIQR